MKIIEMNDGVKVPFEVRGTKIALNDDEMTLNLARYERDDANHLDICRDRFGNLVTGVIPGVAETYVVQIDIPPRAYLETQIEAAPETQEAAEAENGGQNDGTPEGGTTDRPNVKREAVPFDIEKCTLTLWALN